MDDPKYTKLGAMTLVLRLWVTNLKTKLLDNYLP